MERAREACQVDVDRVAELITLGVEELRPTRGGQMWARREARPGPVREELCRALESERYGVYVGEIDDYIVGYGVVEIEQLHDGKRSAMVHDLFVEEPFRAVGVGEALMNEMVEWARAHECVGIGSIALPGNRATKNFFESFGMVARALLVHRPLDDG